jgi:O-antigen/teichoic acid export membrane protein
LGRHRTLILGSALSVLSVAVTTLVGFFLMPFLVHQLGDRMYGYWALVGAVLGYYGILDLGITPAVSFQVAKAIGKGDKESPNRTLSTAVVAFAGLGLIALVITIIVGACCPLFIASVSDVRLFRAVIVIMGAGFAVGFPGRAFMGGLYAHLRNDLIAVIGILVLALRTALIVAVIRAGYGLIGLAMVSLLSDTITYAAIYLVLRKIQTGLRISVALADKTIFKELFNYGRYTVVIRLGDQLRFAVDSWMVAAFLGVAAVAHYTIATRLSGYFLTFILSAVGLLQSWFSQLFGQEDHAGIRKVLALGTRVAASLSTIIACSFIFYGKAFIATWMGAPYVDAYWPSVILIIAIFCDLAQQPSVTYLLGVSRHRYLAYQTLAEGIANLILSLYWARTYGMIGIAMGTLVPMFVAKILMQPAYVCRSAGMPLAKYYMDFARGVAVPALGGYALWVILLRRFTLSNIGEVSLVVGSQAVICALISFYFVFELDDRRRILSKIWPYRPADEGIALN